MENAERHYNRDQRRKLAKRLRRSGMAIDDVIELFERRVKAEQSPPLPEGTKVRLDYDAIVTQVGYSTKTRPEYRAFVEDHKDDVMTVAYDAKHTSGKLVTLAEDTSDPKFLWMTGDLIVVEETKDEMAEVSPDNETA